MTRRPSIHDWVRWLHHHSFAWVSSLLLHALIFLLVLWWGVVSLVPGQGAVQVWLVGGLPGGGGASGPEAGRQSPSRSEGAPSANSGSTVRSHEGSRSSGGLVHPPVTNVRQQPETAAQETSTASGPPTTVVTEPHPAQRERERPTSPIVSLLAKAVPTAVPRVPFQAVSREESPNPSTQGGTRSHLEEGTQKDSTKPESEKRGDGLRGGEHRAESRGEWRGGSGSDTGEGDGKGFRGTSGGVSGIGRGQGIGQGGGGDWRVLLLRRIEGAKRYPARARRLGIEGVTEVQFRITRDGTVEGVTVHKSSGFLLLDRASVETIKRAAPFPPIPGRIRVSISYRLRDTR